MLFLTSIYPIKAIKLPSSMSIQRGKLVLYTHRLPKPSPIKRAGLCYFNIHPRFHPKCLRIRTCIVATNYSVNTNLLLFWTHSNAVNPRVRAAVEDVVESPCFSGITNIALDNKLLAAKKRNFLLLLFFASPQRKVRGWKAIPYDSRSEYPDGVGDRM